MCKANALVGQHGSLLPLGAIGSKILVSIDMCYQNLKLFTVIARSSGDPRTGQLDGVPARVPADFSRLGADRGQSGLSAMGIHLETRNKSAHTTMSGNHETALGTFLGYKVAGARSTISYVARLELTESRTLLGQIGRWLM